MKGCAHDPRTVISEDDWAKIRRFQEFLEGWGGPNVKFADATSEQQAFRTACLADPDWREYLGLPREVPETLEKLL